jgi:hypothetical protein
MLFLTVTKSKFILKYFYVSSKNFLFWFLADIMASLDGSSTKISSLLTMQLNKWISLWNDDKYETE